jgi:hypothetical protein
MSLGMAAAAVILNFFTDLINSQAKATQYK